MHAYRIHVASHSCSAGVVLARELRTSAAQSPNDCEDNNPFCECVLEALVPVLHGDIRQHQSQSSTFFGRTRAEITLLATPLDSQPF
jgi:hypothetical protein